MDYAHFLIFAISLFPYGTTSQLLSCDELGCPSELPGYARCQLEDFTARQVGVSQINSSLSQSPLTWTVGVRAGIPESNTSLPLRRKEFYLGQPPNLGLQAVDSVYGCAIFFEGISWALDFGHHLDLPDLVKDDGTCMDALTEGCVSDWTSQVYSLIRQNNETLNCSELAETLQNNPPGTCKHLGKSWGDVISQEIAGPASPQPIQLNGCTPTIQEDYSLSHIAGFNATMDVITDRMFFTFHAGITPIITVFTPTSSSENSGTGLQLNTPEVHLNCLKIKTGTNYSAPAEITSGSRPSRPPHNSGFLSTAIVMALAWSTFSVV